MGNNKLNALFHFIVIFIFTFCTTPLFAMKWTTYAPRIKRACLNRIKERFDAIYDDIPSAWHGENSIESNRQRNECLKTGGNPVYGEVLYESIEDVLINDFQATPDDIFIDLGSGSGKAPIQFTLLTNGGIGIGLEYVRFRHELALKAQLKLPEDLRKNVYILQGDMFNYHIAPATIFMIDAIMFLEKAKDIVNLFLTYGPKKFRVWSIGETILPFPEHVVKHYKIKKCGTTWGEGFSTLYWIEL